MELKEIIRKIDIWEDWLSSYKKYVPLFIEEAKTKNDWTEWDKDIFHEFFERSADQCVSSLKQGYFTGKEKMAIKEHWKDIAPLLKKIASNQSDPDWETYQNIKNQIRNYTSQDRKASTNRLIASLQPELLCTVVDERYLYELYKLLKKNTSELIPEFVGGNWFKNSFNILRLFQQQLQDRDKMDIITYPWQVIEYFKGDKIKNNVMSDNLNDEITSVLLHKKQIILQGAPGTGKTYTAKDIAEQLIFDSLSNTKKEQKEKLEKSDQYKLVQFHPSYTYEDFVRGIAVETGNEQVEYITKNKILIKFALRAKESWDLYNLEKENKANEVLQAKSKFDQFIDSIQLAIDENGKFQLTPNVYLFEYDEKRFKYKGDNWEAHANGLNMKYSELNKVFDSKFTERSDIRKLSDIESLTSQHATYYTKMADKYSQYKPKENASLPVNKELQNYVLIIDEINRANLPAVLGELIYALEYRGESVESMYAVDGDNKLIIPPNFYIIGTMNTADRSVGQIDYAIRRRFAFIDLLPKELNEEGFDKELFVEISKLFVENYDEYKTNPQVSLKRSIFLSEEFRPEDVWLGHSYFLMKDKEGNNIRDMRLNYEIKPILKEYLKDGILKNNAKDKINKL